MNQSIVENLFVSYYADELMTEESVARVAAIAEWFAARRALTPAINRLSQPSLGECEPHSPGLTEDEQWHLLRDGPLHDLLQNPTVGLAVIGGDRSSFTATVLAAGGPDITVE